MSDLFELSQKAVGELRGVGPTLGARLATLGIISMADLLLHLPRAYEDRRQLRRIVSLRVGEQAQIEGVVVSQRDLPGRRPGLEVLLRDDEGEILLRFFNMRAGRRHAPELGAHLRVYGEVRAQGPRLSMLHPQIEHDNTLALIPTYPLVEGLRQGQLRALIAAALRQLDVDDGLRIDGWSLHRSLHYLHQPPHDADLALLTRARHPAQYRLIVEELAAQQLALLRHKQAAQQRPAWILRQDEALRQQLLAAMGFTLTPAQTRVVNEILHDLSRGQALQRLVQGDVGSGKTAVAALVAAQALHAGWQVALMAPTDLLAEQLYSKMQLWLAAVGQSPAFLSGRITGKARRQLLLRLAQGEQGLVVGTHALFQAEVSFQRLGLVIIDEQHRFGVSQRLALRDKAAAGHEAHLLVMTATPIPRTLAMSCYGDLDCSVIDELPPGRLPITTVVLPQNRRTELMLRLRDTCRQGRQAYWVCTLIETSDSLQAQAAEDCHAELCEALPELRIGLVHGRLGGEHKAAVMQAFARAELDLLVATTVIEVGVDIPTASLMIIENPERLGLAQLHQLRGRVGRGQQDSYCVLLYGAELGAAGRQRLALMRQSQDGFFLAEQDLLLRGPGEFLGTRQAGVIGLRIADLQRDADLMSTANALARHWLELPEPELMRRHQLWQGERSRFARA